MIWRLALSLARSDPPDRLVVAARGVPTSKGPTSCSRLTSPGPMNTARHLFVAFVLATTLSAHAATFIWSGDALIGSKWSNDNNWTTNAPSNNGPAALVFTGSDRLDAEADGSWSILSIAFNSAAGAFSIQGDTVTLGSGGVTNNG